MDIDLWNNGAHWYEQIKFLAFLIGSWNFLPKKKTINFNKIASNIIVWRQKEIYHWQKFNLERVVMKNFSLFIQVKTIPPSSFSKYISVIFLELAREMITFLGEEISSI